MSSYSRPGVSPDPSPAKMIAWGTLAVVVLIAKP